MDFFKVILCMLFLSIGLILGDDHHKHNKKHANKQHVRVHPHHHQRLHNRHHHRLQHHHRHHIHHRIAENGSISISKLFNIIEHINGSFMVGLIPDQNSFGSVNLNTRIIILFNLNDQTYDRYTIPIEIDTATSDLNVTAELFNSSSTNSSQGGSDISDISESTLNEYLEVLQACGDPANYTVDELPSYLADVENLIEILTGSLQGFLEGAGTIQADRGVAFTSDLILALNLLLNDTDDGLQALISAGVELDYDAIYHASSGFEILLIVLQNVAANMDLSIAFGSALSSPEVLVQFIVQFDLEAGVDLLFNVIYNILLLVQGEGSISDLIQAIFKLYNTGDISSAVSELERILQEIMQVIDTQTETYNNSASLQSLIGFISGLENNSFSLGNTDVSQVIDLFKDGSNPIEIIIQIVSQLASAAAAIPQAFQDILALIANSSDPQLISSLVPSFNFSGVPIVGNIFNTVLQGLNVNSLLDGSSDPLSAIGKIPIIGDIIRDIEVSLSVNGNNMSQFLQPQQILNAIQNVFNNSTGSSSETNNIIESIIKGIQNLFSVPVSIASSFTNGISGLISSGLNASQNLANSLQDSFWNLFNGSSFGVSVNKHSDRHHPHHNPNQKEHIRHAGHAKNARHAKNAEHAKNAGQAKEHTGRHAENVHLKQHLKHSDKESHHPAQQHI